MNARIIARETNWEQEPLYWLDNMIDEIHEQMETRERLEGNDEAFFYAYGIATAGTLEDAKSEILEMRRAWFASH